MGKLTKMMNFPGQNFSGNLVEKQARPAKLVAQDAIYNQTDTDIFNSYSPAPKAILIGLDTPTRHWDLPFKENQCVRDKHTCEACHRENRHLKEIILSLVKPAAHVQNEASQVQQEPDQEHGHNQGAPLIVIVVENDEGTSEGSTHRETVVQSLSHIHHCFGNWTEPVEYCA